MTVNPSQAPIACSLNAVGQSSRRAVWESLGERGVRLVFAREPGVEDELRELARLEGECCAFAEWRVEDHDRLVLDVSAETAGVRALQAMFDDSQLALRRHQGGSPARRHDLLAATSHPYGAAIDGRRPSALSWAIG